MNVPRGLDADRSVGVHLCLRPEKDPVNEIELRELLAQLTRSPATAVKDLGDVVLSNLSTHWWQIGVLIISFAVIRYGLHQMRDRMNFRETFTRDGRAAQRMHAQRTMLASVGSFVLWVSFIVSLLGQLGLAISPETFGWIIGSLSLTAAFAFRTYIADALAGWTALAEDRYGVGDYVDANFGVAGTVIGIGLWTTRLRGSDGTIYHIRNSDLDRFGNRTQSVGKLMTDVELSRADKAFVTSAEVDQWEATATEALIGLRSVLNDVHAVVHKVPSAQMNLSAVAQLVPSLAPNLTMDTLSDLRELNEDDTGILPKISDAIRQAPVGATPLFRSIEMLGLVTSTPESVTIRVRVVLADPRSRTYALSLLRRRLFDTFNAHQVSTGFTDVPEGEFIN